MKKYKVRNSGFDIEPHEVFLDKLAHVREEELGISEKKLEVPLKERISYFMFAIFFLLAAVLLVKIFYLQVLDGKKMMIAAENNKGSANILVPERGVIYDKDLKKLVSNSPAFDLVCDRAHFSYSSDIISREINDMAQATGQNMADVSSKIQGSDASQVLIAEDIDHQNLLVLETKINDLQGCYITQNTKRNYLYGPVFSQILGYTSRINKDEYSASQGYAINDYIGKIGLEKYYETYLRGVPGQSRAEKTAAGESEEDKILASPQSGDNLVLNIDADLQSKVYEILGKRLQEIGVKKGAAVAMNPQTGAVLALVSYPSYDDNAFSGGISQKDFQDLLNDPSQPHGWVDMKKALAVSSNIYFYTVGGGYGDQQGLGPTKIKKYLSLFGWDQKTGIDLPGEYAGFIPDPAWKKATKGQGWWDGDTYNLAIGQSDLQTTPLQVASAYCAIANGGTLYKPQIVNKIISGSGKDAKTVREFSPQIIRSNFIDPANLEIVRQGMRDGVTEDYGLSRSLRSLPVSSAAKTGTAQIGRENEFNVWSSVFAPYDNPQIVLVLMAENVQGLSTVIVPAAKEILNWYFSKK
ncbi:MAG: penicillin-binding transpeptidase domain-containing protein [Candidatus Staskawiczbacteria bacterium]|nr:penicillin-binding transpeptidase domain-containing protein [Candidatus Staskawiczbacteria bacterium]